MIVSQDINIAYRFQIVQTDVLEITLEIACVSPEHWWFSISVIKFPDVPNLFSEIQIVWSAASIHLFCLGFFSGEKRMIAHT